MVSPRRSRRRGTAARRRSVAARALPPLTLALALLAAEAASTAAQQAEPDTTEAVPDTIDAVPRDSLLRRVLELEARLDSVSELLSEIRGEEARADTAGGDDVARLRAAARAAAEAGGEEGDGADPGGGSRTRDLSVLNPEISVTGDVVGNWARPADGSSDGGFTPREFEFSFQAALDPYTRTKIFVTNEQEFEIAGLEEALEGSRPDFLEGGEEEHEGFAIEEGYLYWVGLPGGLGAKLGKFRQEIGNYNRWHTHALLEVDRPLAAMHFLGEDGLIQTGASLSLPSVTAAAGTHDLTFEVARGTNGTLFDGGGDLSWLGRLNSFWDLGPSAFLQVGSTAVYGRNDEVAEGLGLDARLLALDALFRWQPGGSSQQRDLRLAAGWYLAEKDYGALELSGHGGYLQANHRLDRRWVAGARADWLDGFGDGPRRFQIAPHVTWWQSEWVRLRLQYSYLEAAGRDPDHTLLLQAVWAMGPHKHETY